MSQLALERVHRMDCRELAAEMVAAGILVDAIITSPPYPQGKKNAEDMGRYRRTGTAAEQREQISGRVHGRVHAHGETGLEVRIAAPDWLDWFLEIADALKPCLKPNGNFVVNVDACCYPTRHKHWGVFSLPERMEQRGWCFADAGPWIKPNGAPTKAPGRFTHSWEFVYVFTNGDRWKFNVDAARAPHKEDWTGRNASRYMVDTGTWHGQKTASPDPGGAKPSDVLTYSVGGTRWAAVGYAHNAPMPLEMAEELVRRYSWEGDLVFDPFGGAGTTPVACIRLGRRWVMAEITEAAALIAERRIQLATQGFMDEEIQPEMPQQMLPLAGRELG